MATQPCATLPAPGRTGAARLLALLSALTAPWHAASAATAIPLHRHARDHWAPAAYEVVVFHRGELTSTAQARIEALDQARAATPVNATLRTIDLAGPMDSSMETLWEAQEQARPPWVIVRAPDVSPEADPVWTGPLDSPTVDHLFDSPARRRLVERLQQGAAAVWVLLECGETPRDEAAVDALSAGLRALERNPPIGTPGPQPAFGLVRVTRNEPAEEFFVSLLEHGQAAATALPLAFPVFGRGRILGALAGRDIDAEGIRAASALLLAPLGEGRPGRPGRDLLIAADWIGGRRSPSPAANPAPATPGTRTPSVRESNQTNWKAWVGALLGVTGAVGGWMWLARQRRTA
ncbi:MAG: hypothetical protein RJA22_1251 [Verrucomicrobiota bacterium]